MVLLGLGFGMFCMYCSSLWELRLWRHFDQYDHSDNKPMQIIPTNLTITYPCWMIMAGDKHVSLLHAWSCLEFITASPVWRVVLSLRQSSAVKWVQSKFSILPPDQDCMHILHERLDKVSRAKRVRTLKMFRVVKYLKHNFLWLQYPNKSNALNFFYIVCTRQRQEPGQIYLHIKHGNILNGSTHKAKHVLQSRFMLSADVL